jgi:hypothetical protein
MVEPEGVCYTNHVLGPIDESPVGLKIRQSHTWPVERHQPNAGGLRGLIR